MLARCPASASTFLWSPQNRGGKIELSPLPIEQDLLIDCICLLSNKPTASNCVVLLVEPYATFIWYCHIGGDQWQKHDYDIGTQPALDLQSEDKEVITPIAACGGKFYFNSTQIELGVLDFCPAPMFSSIKINDVVDDIYGVELAPAQVFLVESDGELYMVSLLWAKTIYGARGHRMDFSEQRWRKVYDLGDRAFLLSLFNSGALCSVGKSGLRENCIYMAYLWEQTLHIFSVKDGSMETHKLDDAPSSDKAFWMLPANHID
ncbi:hypothetical protein CFC21_021557 [Triticum aestivum]|uniref:KIB1-4 beta-propeller domain-containing protein n=2 Tax=Triticum aestivum TaxID=4565 RepID=A0A3B6BZL9_WHEAT|nr:hypothetical protein CFC21_021557 [Triticum aestivum]